MISLQAELLKHYFSSKKCASWANLPSTNVILSCESEGVTQSWTQLSQLAMLLASKVAFSETTVPFSLERAESVIR